MKKYLFTFGTVLALLVLRAPTAFAVQIPAAVEPSRIPEQLPAQGHQNAAMPSIKIPQHAAPVAAPRGAQKIRFKLARVDVRGMTVYTKAEIRPLYAKNLGKTVSLADIYGLAERLTAKYRNDGYVLTQVVVPPQTIKRGIVRLRAVEGFVHKVVISGESGGHNDYLYKMAAPLKAKGPLNIKTLERVLLLMNDLPGVTAHAVLSSAPHTTGASDVSIIVSHKRASFSLETDNRGSRYIGPWQLNAVAELNSPLKHFNAIALQFAKTPDSTEMTYTALTVTMPLGTQGAELSWGANMSRAVPGYDLAQFDITGLSHGLFAQMKYPFIRTRWKNLSAALRLDYLDSLRTDNLGGGTTADRLSVLRLGATYQFADRFVGINTLTAQASRGLGLFHPTTPGTANMTRPRGRSDFSKITAEISRLQRLANRIQLYTAVKGQKSADILLSSEEFGVGGANFGGAYDTDAITGEDGVAARLELRLNTAAEKPWLKEYQTYGYYDIGKVWDPAATTSAGRIAALASAGVGVRATFTDTVSGSFETAVPLTRPVATTGNNHIRIFASLSAKF